MTNQDPQTPEDREAEKQARREAREAAIAAAPLAVVHVESTGIHPSTSRMVSLTIMTLSPEGEIVDEFFEIFNPGGDTGPRHLHGITAEEFEQAHTVERYLRRINTLLDGRTVIMHNVPRTWGFVLGETRSALRALQRRQRSRNRNRRGRRRVGRPPRPVALIDTLASARRLGLPLEDTRVRAVARELGIPSPSPVASVERALLSAEVVSRETAEIIADIYDAEAARGELATYDPTSLRADRFGLQRSAVRVDAMEASAATENPGAFTPGKPLQPGMEFVVSPDIAVDPDEVISSGIAAGLTYNEKITRQTSLLVCNRTSVLRGKAMHADRKGIPLVSDADFLALCK
ncbi:DNA polymerase III subunit epsilon [Corynebacterium kalinowskii]|uniref:DNA polymerase III subunit epsilon n=1 Tax=Corynebacterium kalinowskii TaxID=2675216 RepID=A0A6B8VWI5_9CORY|nr:DNA polymerase III subunit epsilon [Corynebacterium kalinowskii]QGU03056.1 DNA polymerase III subunit epsilon [Corynebacterium kalinowskii]